MNLLDPIVVVVLSSSWQSLGAEHLRTIGHRPERIGKRQHAQFQIWNGDVRSAGSEGRAGRASARCGEVARQQALAGLHIRITRARALRQPLLEPFVVSEYEQLVCLQRPPDGPSELMPFEGTLGGLEVEGQAVRV